MTSIEFMGDSLDDEFDEPIDAEQAIALTAAGDSLIEAIFEKRPHAEIKQLIAADAPLWYQDGEGMSALHAAAYVEDAELVRLLIEKGAIWNAGTESRLSNSSCATVDRLNSIFLVDRLQNTAGDVALSYNNEQCYNIIRDAGIRTGPSNRLTS